MTITGNNAPLKGLVLCGGFSTRMQEDKSSINYHGMPQWQYLVTLLQSLLPEVYISCREDQQEHFAGYPNLVPDSVPFGGPSAGLLSAHALQPETAWLVLACDLPLLSKQSLELLIAQRDATKTATTFVSPVNNLPEPLIAIWEPAGLQALLENVTAGKNCPRKTMLNNDIALFKNPYAAEQFNANTPEEKAEALKDLEK
ncbi:molybdopterin-guanine dinucleotide biosynthesis protein A [Chitinophaga ginsengisegetis]|uniref:Molybdopterin-guanine dinucleotide biosynthesis protein A n=1 Tax=Chitinophaga ginsengisegetis TaxID=393003 RepID=A0A1T5NPF9_9BACT|nr:NTP transferase domain-containing protein [Chitinophaga ginsengisegetis]MDR6565721.1 molybdopterin-guanine dinucleotide biosynthesis protein A [Chitinophaga ginsengisegetis]MDR6645450.1 molybdopterin-guanine dinucleotide biosynthesis protein A [Chitinophaga ginsengisegetis]MDR6651958.1 molybdopterin-guanine dinucleotide biosynthesis protein A [Chitinophaga ginsengisegetis]SKD02490.1 molybdopterin-guanine dinucleotide biosynthesis protein A [Chitinophaga ginsengisegetis]